MITILCPKETAFFTGQGRISNFRPQPSSLILQHTTLPRQRDANVLLDTLRRQRRLQHPFHVHHLCHRPHSTHHGRQPSATGGDLPTSVAASSTLNTACIAHTGAAAGIACANFDATTGLSAFDALRPFNLGQTNPPTGPFNGIGDTFFNEDSSALITAVKGNPPVNHTGFVSTFPVSNGAVSTQDTQTSPAGTAVLFGTAVIPGTSNVLATDASFGSAVLDLNNLATPLATTKIADQAATCWAAFSPVTGTGFVTEVAVNHLVEVTLASGAIVQELNSTNGNPGMIDLQAAGNNIFALSPGNATIPTAVTVFDLSGGSGNTKEVQNFQVMGGDINAQGMAVFV